MLSMSIVVALLADPMNPVAEREHDCMIRNAIYEANGEGIKGMHLVSEVVMNRYERNYRGATSFCEVVYSPTQFSWTLIPEENRLEYTQDEYYRAAQVVLSLVYGEVERILPPSVLHYLNRHQATDLSWYDTSKVFAVYGNHEFLAGVR